MIIDGLFITLLASSALACWCKDYWTVIILHFVASLSLAWTVVASHNYIHRRDNWRMYLFNLSLWSYRDFRVSHALSHHLYTNTLMDLEISGFEPLVFWNSRKQPFLAHFAFLTEQIVFPFVFILNFLKRLSLNFLRDGFFAQHYRWHDAIGFFLLIWMWKVSGEPFSKVLSSFFWIICGGSYITMTIGANAAHHHPKIFKDGDQVREATLDWATHELETVMDRKEINSNLFTVMTFFGEHALHHLFPTLDHAILPYLYPVFLEHCLKFRGNLRVTDSFDLFIGQIKQLMKTDPNLLEDQ